MPTISIQQRARNVQTLLHRYGPIDDDVLNMHVRELVGALVGVDGRNARTIDVDDWTLALYACGIAVNAGENPDMDSRQPFASVNTEELSAEHRYGANANLVMERDSLVRVGGGPTDRVQALNAEIDRQSGMPKIAVHLNDATLYDDEGTGNTVAREVYVVRPSDESADLAAFVEHDDAEAYSAALGENGVDTGDVESCMLITHREALDLIAQEQRGTDEETS